ncbi:bifunctional 4-hydroxy-2-oxoglutarate aldolase/2-dehydro-3-deoxy-phosphogluconate aldolase [Christiangramia flava]|uniref:4-Hydroxy-2-oxoglutarate aldolase n=1 Tax=Christiangramia flava JLT2011 TaxID=1229726 RepID=A0A1L7I5K8_9FLAO|nr:bifunctional 4-hydroxy-2-oxoglutarate aldolase/2-dehydro-3-deoxy-phosphogluconate aldolase [Christiangramia flava]APU68890.1 4-Hydroxy-2-oxoglutarate aldolase [Christiangramia flava JLT2011]OSS38964.1 4-Hydroxy-2-oxoglutarate aldolase [Christiangramia flava JLT2011]
MAKFSRIGVVQEMEKTGLVPVFYHSDLETCKNIVRSSYDAGIRVFEFTNRGDFAQDIFAALVRYAEKECPGLMLGIGSVIDPATTAMYLQLGANFIVSPIMNPEMARICNRRKVAWMPGCGTLTEISEAQECGAEVVKIFPASEVGGPSFIKAVKGPMPWTSIMPTGGVSPNKENLQEWFGAGAHCVGIGSKLFIKKDGAYDFSAIQKKIEDSLQIIKELKLEK